MQSFKKAVYPFLIKLSRIRFISFYLNDLKYRTKVSLIFGFILNLSFSVFKFITGIIYQSIWFGAVGLYYFLLSVLRITTFKSMTDLKKFDDNERHIKEQFVGRIIGVFLLILGIAMLVMMFEVLYREKPFIYPDYIVVILTIFAAYRLTAATTNFLKFRKEKQSLFSIAKAIDLAALFMAILTLQTAILTRIGMSTNIRSTINFITGIVICGTIILISISIITKSHKEIKQLKLKKRAV